MSLSPRSTAFESSIRSTLSADRVVLDSLEHALSLTRCGVAFLHVGFGGTRLCIARHVGDPAGRIRRATMCETVADLTHLESFDDVPRFPHEPPRDLFDPTRVRAYAVAPLPADRGVRGALVCLDERPRPFTAGQLNDLETLAFTIIGRLTPHADGTPLGHRLRSLRNELEPVTAMVAGSPQLSRNWRELTGAIEEAAAELDGPASAA